MRLTLIAILLGLTTIARATALDHDLKAKIDSKLTEIQAIAADPVIVEAVVAQNHGLAAEYAALTQEKWASLTVLDPLVRSFSKNAAGQALKTHKKPWISEAFVSDAKGFKVAFLAKTSNWCHAGKAKQDGPMGGHIWHGEVELDESTGTQQVQVAVPVIAEGHPVGVLTIGIALTKLE